MFDFVLGDMYARGTNNGGTLTSANIGVMPPTTGPANNTNKPSTEYCGGYGPYGEFIPKHYSN